MTSDNLVQFLSDNHFKEWVLSPQDAELSAFWQKWLSENPEMQPEIEHLKALILKINPPTQTLNVKNERELWENIRYTLGEEVEETTPVRPLFKAKWWALAAAFAGILAASVYLFSNQKTEQTATIQTTYGETRTLRLPDGSEVILNANSTLSYTDKWTIGEDRNVTLKGEAYFIVNEQSTATHRDRFIVHTPELDVEVLGTRFNVNTYRPQTQVVLQKGSVDIVTKINKSEKKYSLVPGQSAVFDKQKDVVNISKVNATAFVSWKDNRFVFDQTPLSDVAIMLENTYGIKVIINNKELAAKQISGEIPTSERASLLLALSTLYSLKIEEINKDTLIIR
jgi:transmembrane sensor